jgi:hypothetical protein
MKKTLVALAAATTLTAATFTVPTKAAATPAWFWPAVIIGGVVAGGAIVHGYGWAGPRAAYGYAPGPYAYAPGGFYVESCRVERVRTSRGWRRVEVC